MLCVNRVVNAAINPRKVPMSTPPIPTTKKFAIPANTSMGSMVFIWQRDLNKLYRTCPGERKSIVKSPSKFPIIAVAIEKPAWPSNENISSVYPSVWWSVPITVHLFISFSKVVLSSFKHKALLKGCCQENYFEGEGDFKIITHLIPKTLFFTYYLTDYF